MNRLTEIALVLSICGLGCVPNPKSGKGFSLPEGDVEKGAQVYRELQCNACHQISGIEQAVADGATEPAMSIALGGEVPRIETYGELVTSIINPSHKLAPGYAKDDVAVEGVSKMRNYNEVMTVQQLADLVTFLQSKYKLLEYEPTDYPVYPYAY
jgi:mono/diheme cytochrome c family protein